MINPTDQSPHFHIHWKDKENPDWECIETLVEALKRAAELAYPGESFTIDEVSEKCPLLKKRQAVSSRMSL